MLRKLRKKIAPGTADPTTSRTQSLNSPPDASPNLLHRRNGSSASEPTKEWSSISRPGLQSSQSSSYGGVSSTPGDSLGLRVIHQPEGPAHADIIFVHGLGGQSHRTWCKDHNVDLFWPGQWLPYDVEIGKARIFSFGYNSGYGPGSNRSVTKIADFAKDLLNDMRFGQDEGGTEFHLGRAPIVFVMHSMGGLVVKKAYLLGQNDKAYDHIIRSVSAMVFLGTPHRGSAFAETLNKILMASFNSTKSFITDLSQHSLTLEELNESFRHVADRLDIWSFYETRTTKLAGRQLLIVGKDSAVLGYPAEISAPLDADHRNVCKYSSTDEGNYISVRNALRSLVGKFTSPGTNTARTLDCSSINDIEQLLAVSRDEDDDFATIHSQWFPGTCSWLLDQACVKSFLTPVSQSHVLWYSAPPGSGKSVMSAFVVDHLRQQGLEPQFYFFRHADQKQRSLSHCLHTIAYQLVTHDVNFRARVHGLAKEGLRMAKAGPKLVWQKLFESILFSVELTSRPLFWVIDGLDEADSPGILFELLHSLSRSRQSVRLLIVSRKTQTLSSAFDGLSEKIQVSRLENAGLAHNSDDIVTIVGREVELMSGSESFKSATKCSIIQRAEGNILWVRLVLREILACHTEDEVRQSLHDIPSDMTSFYKRMENAIAKNPARANTTLAKTLLHWSVCSRRRLKLEELEGAMPSILNLRRTINEICGQLVVVDAGGTVGLIHQTAGEYLTGPSASELHIDRVCAHEELCLATIAALSRPGLRVEATEQPQAVKQAVSFTTYAATSWTCHLLESSQSDKSIDAAAKFLHGTAVLTWIHILALLDQLDVLVRAAKDFTSAATKIRKAQAGKNPLLQKLAEVELLERWSVDLTKIVAKFRKPLQEEPMTIYKVIPAMCPALSITYEQFSRSHSLEVTLSGIPPDAWNDNLVRLAMPNGDKGTQIVSAGSHVAVLGTVGTTYVWGSRDFRLARTLDHGEPVTAICLNKKGDRLATSGLKSTKSWSIETGETLSCTPNIADVKAMALEYTDDDKELLVVADDRIVRSLDLTDISSAWQVLCEGPARQDDFEKKFVNSPNCVRFNGDRTQVGLSYRGFPLAVWSLAENRCIGRSKRSRSFRGGSGRPSTTWFGVDRFTFNPITGHVIGVYKDGCVFKWHPLTGENQEAQAVADEVAASPDGKLFITTDTDGNIAVWSFAYMTKIYQLNSNDLVTGLVFSPDARRFYDIRGRSANAWEPNALVRFAEREASHTDTASEEQTSDTTHTSEAHLDPFEPITAMAVISSSATFCFGDEEGAVYSYDADTEQKFQLMKFSNYQCISHLELSAQGDCVVAADLSGEVMIKLLGTQPLGKKKPTPEVNSLQRPRFDLQGHGIDHILFNRLGNLLLVASNDSAQVWSIDRASIIACNPLELGSRRKWILHPTKDDLFLGFGPRDVDAYRWTTLEKVVTIPICEEGLEANDIHHRPQPSASESQVTKALSTEDGQHVIIQVRELVRGVSCKRLMIFDSDACDSLTAPSTRALHYRRLPQDIHCKVDIALGILRKDRSFQLAFLDCDLWLCTLELEGPQHHATVKRRYFVPRDWASTESLELSHVLTDGTLLSPKGADVAIVTYSGDT